MTSLNPSGRITRLALILEQANVFKLAEQHTGHLLKTLPGDLAMRLRTYTTRTTLVALTPTQRTRDFTAFFALCADTKWVKSALATEPITAEGFEDDIVASAVMYYCSLYAAHTFFTNECPVGENMRLLQEDAATVALSK